MSFFQWNNKKEKAKIAIIHVFHCQVPQKILEHPACDLMFKQLPLDMQNVNEKTKMYDPFIKL